MDGNTFRTQPHRPRSLCDAKLLSTRIVHVTGNGGGLHGPPERPPPEPPADASKYRGSWPNVHYNGTASSGASSGHHAQLERKAPSMAALMNTTVPQRLTRPGPRPGGQHTPTRNSLRHSRMICLSQQGKVPRKYLPPVIHHYRTGCGLVAAQLVLGTALLALALRLLLWSPQLNGRDVPHWSGTTLVMSGAFGLFLLCCCRKQYPGMRGGCCVFIVRVQYIVCNACLAMAATAACVCAGVFAGIHASHLSALDCQSPAENVTLKWTVDEEHSNATCLCAAGETTTTTTYYTYDPLPCADVLHALPAYLWTSAVTNAAACLVTCWYAVLLWSNRFAYTYAGLRTSEPKAAVVSAVYH